jgi:hypothetical protein
VETLAATPFDTSTDYFINVLDARAHASELALRAAQSSLLHSGARGYLLSNGVQRRVRRIALRRHRLAGHQAPAQGDRAPVGSRRCRHE